MYHRPSADAEYDPNHPPALDISATAGETLHEYDQAQSIGRYGIAGRVWDATFPILPYLSRPSETHLAFSPACTIFDAPATVLELGSGQSHASIHLLTELAHNRANAASPPGAVATSRVILTDLDNVVPLVNSSVGRWLVKTGDDPARPDVHVCPLPWGDTTAAQRILRAAGGISHILMIDLIYFPHLYGRLLRTLLSLTQPPGCTPHSSPMERDPGPEIILCYKSRSLAFEETFFHAFERWFRMSPLLSRTRPSQPSPTASAAAAAVEAPPWTVHGKTQDVAVYICRRRAETVPDVLGWTPETDQDVMAGPRRRAGGGGRGGGGGGDEAEADEGRVRPDARADRGWGWAEAQLGAIEWE